MMSYVSYGWPSPSPADRCNDQLQAKTCCAWFCSTYLNLVTASYSFIFHLNHVHFQFILLYPNVVDLSLTKSTPMPGTRRRARSWILTHQMSWSLTRNAMSLFKVQHLTPRQKHQILSVQEMQQLCEAEGLTLQGFRAQVHGPCQRLAKSESSHNFICLRCFIIIHNPILTIGVSALRLYIALQHFHSTIEDAASFRLHTTLFSACFWQDGQRRHCFS